MSDYGHQLSFGALLEPGEKPQDVVALAGVMEAAGLDTVSLSDHP